jgi:hypothetical protein
MGGGLGQRPPPPPALPPWEVLGWRVNSNYTWIGAKRAIVNNVRCYFGEARLWASILEKSRLGSLIIANNSHTSFSLPFTRPPLLPCCCSPKVSFAGCSRYVRAQRATLLVSVAESSSRVDDVERLCRHTASSAPRRRSRRGCGPLPGPAQSPPPSPVSSVAPAVWNTDPELAAGSLELESSPR